MQTIGERDGARVLIIGQNYKIAGGSDRYLVELAANLEREGVNVAVFAARDGRNISSYWDQYFPEAANFESPAPIDILRYIYSIGASRALSALLNENDIRAAHLNIYYGKLTASIFGSLRKRGLPILQTLHEYKAICPVYTLVSNGSICEQCYVGVYYRCATKRCNRGSVGRSILSTIEASVSHALGAINSVDQFIAVSDFSRRKHIEHGIPESKIAAIQNFVTLDGIVSDSDVGEDVLYFGRIEKVKGVFTLLEAASHMPSVSFLFVGTGNALDQLKEEAAQRGINNVRFLGHLSGFELDRVIRKARCTVLPAEWYEPFGLTILESFARGRCVVGSRIGGIPEIITHGEHGLLFSPGNVAELVEHLQFLVSNRAAAAEMGRAGRRRAEREFSWPVYFEKLKEVYRRVGVAL